MGSMLVMQVCVLLFALGMFWLTLLVSRSALKESLDDWGRICVLLGKAERK